MCSGWCVAAGMQLLVGVCYQQVAQWDGEQQFDEGGERVVQRGVLVEPEHAEVDVVSRQRRLQHQEADRDALERAAVKVIQR